MSVPWLDLPDEVWEIILGYLNVRSLLKASETCSKFNNVMGKSNKLMKMIRLSIVISVNYFLEGYHGDQNKLKCYRQIKALKENLKMSGRNYQNSGLSLLGRHRGWSVPLDTIMTDILMEICEIFQIFSESIIDFQIEQCNIENKVFTKIIRIFGNLQKCLIDDTEIYGDDSDLSLKLPKLEDISLRPVEGIMIKNLLHSFDNLKKLEIVDYAYRVDVQIEEFFKNLLLKHYNLKIFHVKYPEIFGLNVLPNTEFSLESLSLKCSKWKNMDHAENFFKKQTHLKDIHLELHDNTEGLNFRYTDILKDIFNLNQNLTDIIIQIYFEVENVKILNGIYRPKVKSLSFESSVVNSDLFAALVKMCPKVKNLAYRSELMNIDRAAISTLAELEFLKISSEKESIQDLIICSERFSKVSIMSYIQDDEIKLFLSNHKAIEHLIIQNMTVSHGLCEYIVNCLPNLRSFVFFELETETLQLLLTLKYLRCLKTTSVERMNKQVKQICSSAGIEIELTEREYEFHL